MMMMMTIQTIWDSISLFGFYLRQSATTNTVIICHVARIILTVTDYLQWTMVVVAVEQLSLQYPTAIQRRIPQCLWPLNIPF